MPTQDIETRFTYHAPRGEQPQLYEDLRRKAKELAYVIDLSMPDGREKALALTNLEQAMFWADAGIARA